MKRIIFALILVAALTGTAFASAAGMSVNGGAVQAGSDGNLVCQTGTLAVDSWQLFGLGADNQYVETFTVKGINPNCAGARLMASVYTSDGGVYGSSTSDTAYAYYTIPSNIDPNTPVQLWIKVGDTAQTVHLLPENIVGVKMFIEGGPTAK